MMMDTANGKLLTVDTIMAWGPWNSRERVEDLVGAGLTVLQFCDLEIPADDRLWALLREDVIPELELRLLACDFAETVLPIYEKRVPGDDRVRRCIDTARKFACGEATKEALAAARSAAGAAWEAAGAARSAAGAAWDASGEVSWEAARSAQLKLVRSVLCALEGVEVGR